MVEQSEESEYDFGGARVTRLIVKTGDILMRVESSIQESIVLNYSIPNSAKQGQHGFIEKEWIIPPAEPGEKVYIEERYFDRWF